MPQPRLKQFRSKRASLWQSAVDRVAGGSPVSPGAGLEAESAAAAAGRIPPQDERAAASIEAGDEIAAMLNEDTLPDIPPPPGAAAGFLDRIGFCSKTALRIAEARVKSIFTGDSKELKAL